MVWNRYIVSKGYLVVAIDVRGSGGYGHLFEEYIHYRFGAQEVYDLREVISFLKLQPYVDAKRFGIWGCDYGAHTVVHAMLEYPYGFKAGFADSPITNWSNYDAYFTERYLGLPRQHKIEYDDSSALEHARRTTGDLFVAASRVNAIIRADQLEALEKAMKEAKHGAVANRLHVLTLADPAYRQQLSGLTTLFSAMTEFFEHTL
jgi:dipeptidyl-peptidase-4